MISYLCMYSITVMASDVNDNLFYLSKLGKCAHIVAPVTYCAYNAWTYHTIFLSNLYAAKGS